MGSGKGHGWGGIAAAIALVLSGCGDMGAEKGGASTLTVTDATTGPQEQASQTGTGADNKGGGQSAWSDASSGAPQAKDASAPLPPVPPGADAGSSAGASTAGPDAGGDVKTATCNTKDPTVLYLSADDSNSMAGATIARGLINQGQLVDKAVRTYEFLNYYSFAYPPAQPGHVAPSAQIRKDDKGEFHLQIGVRAPDFTAETRRRLNLVLAVDTSASMGWGTPGSTGIDLARTACLGLVGALGKDDRFSLIGWGGTAEVLVDGKLLAGPDDGSLAKACMDLKPQGHTSLGGALAAAYALAQKGFAPDRINRVVLLSDGGASVGTTDKDVVVQAAKAATGSAIQLMGIGVGDPWNYHDKLMDLVTDAGKGAYVFLDSGTEALSVFADHLLRHVELAALDVQVEVTLPPTLQMEAFYGEQVSTKAEEVDPQHLATNDAMVFHQVLKSCQPEALTGQEPVTVKATWTHPGTLQKHVDTYTATLAELLAGDKALLRKGEAVVAYAEALKDTQKLLGQPAVARVDQALAVVGAVQAEQPKDGELTEIALLLGAYRKVFEQGQNEPWATGGTGVGPIEPNCGKCEGIGATLAAMACALELCDSAVLLDQSYGSPTQSPTAGTFAAVPRYGSPNNDLAPQVGNGYAVFATGPAIGTGHSVALGGTSIVDPITKAGGVHDAVEWKLKLKAPQGAAGLRFRHVFFSEEYDEYVGSTFNDKFYVILEAGSTNGGAPTVINSTGCRDPNGHYDFVCSPGMQFCNPRQKYCYIAVNTAVSECCWLNGCPQGKAKTDISGTGFGCADSQSSDSASKGSSTGWLQTEWPIEPGETFTLTFHLHDTGDGIYDSAAILDGLHFVSSVTPGTWPIQPNL